jgi:error-prone DNA polymerase
VYPSPEIEKALQRTLGVPIFQEQVMQIAMLAAGFSAGEADELRRAMAAWKRKGGVDKFYSRVVDGMTARGYERAFAEQIFSQIQGFGEYGFPESHAASFALLVYVSAWLKCHEPAAFLAALLNSQPMGFYSPSQLVQDGQRHGVQVLPPDVGISEWDSTLEEMPDSAQPSAARPSAARPDAARPDAARPDAARPAVRLGLSRVKGLSAEAAARVVETRAIRPFDNIDDLTRRAELSAQDMGALAHANALLHLAGHRREAAWEVAAITSMPKLLKDAPIHEAPLRLAPGTEGQEILADYRSMGLTLNRHPLALLRDRLKALNLSTAQELQGFANGKLARSSGIVVMRQRPPTAKGTLFITIEDETGITNVIVWPALVEKQRRELLGASLLTVYGVWQREGGVTHLVAKRVVDHTDLLGHLAVPSRDFF